MVRDETWIILRVLSITLEILLLLVLEMLLLVLMMLLLATGISPSLFAEFCTTFIKLWARLHKTRSERNWFEIYVLGKISLRYKVTSLLVFTWVQVKWNSLRCKFHFGQIDRTTFQSSMRFQTCLSSLRVSYKCALSTAFLMSSLRWVFAAIFSSVLIWKNEHVRTWPQKLHFFYLVYTSH